MNKIFKGLFIPIILLCFVFLLSFFKFSFVLGSHKMFFSGINCILPLFGAFLSLPASLFLIFVFFSMKSLLGFTFITAGLPTLIAAASWTKTNKIINFLLNLLLPLICMALFILHPIAGQAFIYSFYWLIPVGLFFVNKRAPFSLALSATFIAHAVGSIIWLYTVPMTSAQWFVLIPVVAIERLTIACGLTVMFYVLRRIECFQKRFIPTVGSQFHYGIFGK